MVTGLSAFPLTPLHDDRVHEPSFIGLIERLAHATIDEITVLGSTGSYAYLHRDERARVTDLAVQHASGTPVSVGVGALRTSAVLQHVRDAERAGVARVLLAPMSYQPLTDDDVFTLFRTVTEHTDLPVVVYDNPGTTRVRFSPELLARVCGLQGITGVKIPPVPLDPAAARAHIQSLRALLPAHISLGISGDRAAAVGLLGGCDTWYSVLAGVLPELANRVAQPGVAGDEHAALSATQQLEPLWQMFADHGSFRVAAALAETLGMVPENCAPLPILGLDAAARAQLVAVLRELGVPTGCVTSPIWVR